MKKIIFYILIFLSFNSISFGQQWSAESELKIDTAKNVIFDYSKLDNSLRNFLHIDYGKGLELRNNDLAIINKLLNKRVLDYNKTKDSSVIFLEYYDSVFLDTINLNEYTCQYIPYINKIGKRKVLLNMICNSHIEKLTAFGLYWKKDPIIAADGGQCFFKVLINLDKRSIERFEVNGEVGGSVSRSIVIESGGIRRKTSN